MAISRFAMKDDVAEEKDSVVMESGRKIECGCTRRDTSRVKNSEGGAHRV